MIYFTADTHFNHSNVINLCDRPFDTIEQMNKVLTENWNSCVTNRDEIYILGDFIFRKNGVEANEIIRKLKGKKYLIRGNHDKYIDSSDFDKSGFEWIQDYYALYYKKLKFVLFHYPICEWDGYFRDSIHLYGHVHHGGNSPEQQKRLEALGHRAINVGVDVHDYYPVSIEAILKMVEQVPSEPGTEIS
jgi:calcineurin-like phosphoesterase family protein